MWNKLIALLCVGVFVLTGCATQQMDFERHISDTQQPEHVEWQNFFIYALVPPQHRVQATDYCPGGDVARVETELTFLNGLLHALTYGIYTPYTMKVYCTAP